MPQPRKPKVAIQSLTGCAGCQLTVYFIKDILLGLLGQIDLVAASMIKGRNEEGPYDVCFVEGGVVYQEDLDRLKAFREQSEVLVALGTCATHGNVQQIKRFMDDDKVEKAAYGNRLEHLAKGKLKRLPPAPLEAHVKVDYAISGCPPEEAEVVRFIKDLLLGKRPAIFNEPVCEECTLKENRCLLEAGEECLGPLIRGGCGALCPSAGHPCTGCHGPLEDGNFLQGIRLLEENGMDARTIRQRLDKYAGLKFQELEKSLKLKG
ncbi:hypothetical protein JXB02_01005 [Candidatus Woesearchaeota archaeon]|nr:hypothetical protein [Candidatus Woesearchaeota archaeon]